MPSATFSESISIQRQPATMLPRSAMSAETGTGKRTVTCYCLSPLRQHMQESLHERRGGGAYDAEYNIKNNNKIKPGTFIKSQIPPLNNRWGQLEEQVSNESLS